MKKSRNIVEIQKKIKFSNPIGKSDLMIKNLNERLLNESK